MFDRYRRATYSDLERVEAPQDRSSTNAVPQSEEVQLPPPPVVEATQSDGASDELKRRVALKVELHRRLLEMLNLSAIERASEIELRGEISAIARELLDEDGVIMRERDFDRLVGELLHEVTGFGPLEPLLKDDMVSDILVNTHESVYVERSGTLEKTRVRFKDDEHLMRVIDKIVRSVGRRIDESQPWVDARLPDGSRVNALIPPCAVDGPLLSIRKFNKVPYSIERLVEIGTLNQNMAKYLAAIVATRLNVLISGGTGSGKTTTLNALSNFVSDRERIVTIEDTAELQLQQSHVGRMEARPANFEGRGEVSQRDLLRNALRMRPDRIIVGEVRGGEVIDMLQAMNTGHEGSMTTIHANTPRDALGRIENMVAMSNVTMPHAALRSQIASAINVIIQVQRLSDGRRRFTSIQEITGVEADMVTMQEVFRFERTGVDGSGNVLGRMVATGLRSKFDERFRQWGVEVPRDLYAPPSPNN